MTNGSGASHYDARSNNEAAIKKKKLQSSLREIKKLMAARCHSDSLSSVDALQMVLSHLRRQPTSATMEASTSHVDDAVFDDLGTDLNAAQCQRSFHTKLTIKSDDFHVTSAHHDDQSTSSLIDKEKCLLDIILEVDHAHLRRLLSSNTPGTSIICRLRPIDDITPNPIRIIIDQPRPKTSTDDNNNDTINSPLVNVTIAYLFSVYAHDRAADQELRFTTRHSIDGRFEFVSDGCVPALGILPQQLSSESVFDYVHCDDTAVLVAAMMSARLQYTRGTQWRCVCAHGKYIGLVSDWTTYVNPWTRRVEAILGVHRVAHPPKTPNIFASMPPALDTQLTSADKQAVVAKLNETMRQAIVEQRTTSPIHQPLHVGVIQPPLSGLHLKAQRATNVHRQHLDVIDAFSNISQDDGGRGAQEEPLALVVNKRPAVVVNDHNSVTPPQLVTSQHQLCNLYEDVIVAMASQPSSQLLHDSLTAGRVLPQSMMTPEHQRQRPIDHSASAPLFHTRDGSQAESQISPGHMSYTQINYLENVHRLLVSRPPTGEDGAEGVGRTPSPTAPPMPITTMHRSLSTSTAPLTKELLHRHTQNCEREYKQTWKRRISSQSQISQNGSGLNMIAPPVITARSPVTQDSNPSPIVFNAAKPKRKRVTKPKKQELKRPKVSPVQPRSPLLASSPSATAPPLQVSSTVVTPRANHPATSSSSTVEISRIPLLQPSHNFTAPTFSNVHRPRTVNHQPSTVNQHHQLQQLMQHIQQNGAQLPDVLQARLAQQPQLQNAHLFRQPRPQPQQPQLWMANNVGVGHSLHNGVAQFTNESAQNTADSSAHSQIKEVTDALMLLQELS